MRKILRLIFSSNSKILERELGVTPQRHAGIAEAKRRRARDDRELWVPAEPDHDVDLTDEWR